MFNGLFGTKLRALLTVLGWVLLVGVLTAVAPPLKDVQSPSDEKVGPEAASAQAQVILDEHFADAEAVPAIITVPKGKAGEALEAINSVRGENFGPTITAACRMPGPECVPGSPEELTSGDTELLVVPVTGDPTTKEYRDGIETLREALGAGPDSDVHVTGPVGIITDTVNVFAGGDKVLLLATVGILLLILLAVYRAPLMAVLPLVAVGFAMMLAQSIGALLAKAGVIDISSQTASIMTVLLFGVGTDYALIITARWRERLREEDNPAQAMVHAMDKTFPVIASSGGTIVAAMMALLATKSPVLQGFGPYLAIGVVAAMLAAFTVLPALMVLAGRATLWPTKPTLAHDSRIWTKVADIVLSRPKAVLAGATAFLILCSAGLTGYAVTYNMLSGFRIATDSAAGQEIIAEDFGPGEVSPSTLVLRGEGADKAAASVAAQLDDAARVSFNPRMDVDGDVARISVVLNNDPYSVAAFDELGRLTEEARGIAQQEADVEVLAAGETATSADSRVDVESDFKLLVPLIILIIAGILAVLLRSWLAPIYLGATLMLSLIATLGLTVLVAVTLQGDSGLGSFVPVYILVFLTALGVDYTIFVMARLRQEMHDKTMLEAMRRAIITTGGVVSSAGLILAATFAVLMTQPIRELYQFGLAMMIGILLDTFIVRPLLVPAIVALLGDKALAPSKPGVEAQAKL